MSSMYASYISHCVHCDEYSTDGGGSVIVPRSRSPLLAVCEVLSEKLNWLRSPRASSSVASLASPASLRLSSSFACPSRE